MPLAHRRTRSALLFTALAVALVLVVPAIASATVSETALPTWGTDNSTYAATRSGSNVYLGGSFYTVGVNAGAGNVFDTTTAALSVSRPVALMGQAHAG